MAELDKINKLNEINSYINKLTEDEYPKTLEAALKKGSKFWINEPVPQLTEKIMKDGPIEENKITTEISQVPLKIPEDFYWDSIDMNDKNNCQEVSNFLDKYYIQNMESQFKLHYSGEFLNWILSLNGEKIDPEFCVGIRVTKNNILVGFIAATVGKMKVNKNILDMIDVNFLCIHTKLRNKGLAPIMIKELTRRLYRKGYNQAMYTGPRYLPKPIVTVKYYHRALNITPLIETGFTKLQGKISVNDLKRTLKLPSKPFTKNFVEMNESHIDSAYEHLDDYFNKYNCHPIFSKEEFRRIFLNNKFVTAYVVDGGLTDDNSNNREVLDFISFYSLPSRVCNNNTKHKFLNTAYLFYYTSKNETTYRLIRDIMIIARNKGFHVFNAVDIMEHEHNLRDLNFEPGTGTLHYYFYNWKCRDINNNQIAKIVF